MYTLSSYPVSSLEIHKRVIFCHSNLPQLIDRSLLKMWNWKCDSRPFSSHLNEPWGMRITQYFGCTLSPMCEADTASSQPSKGYAALACFHIWSMQIYSPLHGSFPGWVFYNKTGIKFPAQSELIALSPHPHRILSPSQTMHFHMTLNMFSNLLLCIRWGTNYLCTQAWFVQTRPNLSHQACL